MDRRRPGRRSPVFALPEHRHRPDQVPAGTEQRERGDLHLAIYAVEATKDDPPMDGTQLAHGDPQRNLILRQWIAVLVANGECPCELATVQIAHLVEAAAEEPLRRFVEEQQVAGFVGNERRYGKAGRELPHEDQADVSLRHARIVPPRPPRVTPKLELS